MPEYWLVDPKNPTLERLVLTKKDHVLREKYGADDVFAPKELRGLKISLVELWARPKKK